MALITKIIRNEAAKNDPKEIYNWRVYLLCASVSLIVHEVEYSANFDTQACFGGMTFGMDTGIIGGVLKLDPFREHVKTLLTV
jgi:hypothetical protein